MNMLTKYQVELIHREIDGENTPEASLEVQELVNTQPEARALMTSLKSLDALFRDVPDREPDPRVRQQIQNAMSMNSRASPKAAYAQRTTQTITSWATQQWNGVTNFMGELMLTKRVLIIATTAVALIAIIGEVVVGYKPSVFDAGTIGAKDGMSGVQQATRYKGRTLTTADVTLSNPAIAALFQDDKVLQLVKSDAFREVMHDDAFRELQSSDAFREVLSSDAFHDVLKNDAARELFASDAFHEVMKDDALREVFSSDVAHDAAQKVSQNDAAHDANQKVSQSDALREVMKNDALREILKNDAARDVLASDAFHTLFANDAFREVLKNDAFHEVLANDAYRELLSSDMFRAVTREQSLSEAFLNDAMHAQY
jgi:hypothetical protein